MIRSAKNKITFKGGGGGEKCCDVELRGHRK